jgi:hypothetical protein
MASIYVENWEMWTTTHCKLIKFDTDNLRESFPQMAEWTDEQIKKHLDENNGNIVFDSSISTKELMSQSYDVEENEYQWDEPSDSGTQVFQSSKDWSSKAWWRGNNDLRCEDRSKDYHEIIDHFLSTMNATDVNVQEDENTGPPEIPTF